MIHHDVKLKKKKPVPLAQRKNLTEGMIGRRHCHWSWSKRRFSIGGGVKEMLFWGEIRAVDVEFGRI